MKIVALGDSLTVGETGFSDSDESASYPKCLEILANEYLRSVQSVVKVNVLNRGINGDLTSGMLERFSRDVVDEKADYVIILGGTNDLGWGFDPAMIAHNLTRMYDAALNKGIVSLACLVQIFPNLSKSRFSSLVSKYGHAYPGAAFMYR